MSPLAEKLEDIGGWPLIDGNWKDEEFTWYGSTFFLLDQSFLREAIQLIFVITYIWTLGKVAKKVVPYM